MTKSVHLFTYLILFDYNKYHSAGRRQKKKSRRTADTFPRAYEAAALRKIRAAVSFCFSDDAHAIRRAVYRRIPPCQFSSFTIAMSYTN